MTDQNHSLGLLRTKSVSSLSLGVFRALYGAVMCFSLARFMLSGWIEELFVKPSFFFKYSWATWMPVWDPLGLYLHISITLIASFGVMTGLYFKRSLALFLFGFTSLQLMDQTNYLNHYYLVICLAFPLAICPAGQTLSLDCLWRGRPIQQYIPAWQIDLLRFQLGIVYVFAAIAKMNSDWLVYGQPLSIWLSARADLPIIGGLLGEHSTALLMSWSGFLYDLLIIPALLYPRTRTLAYLCVITFHGVTWALFDIGIFPILMTLLTPIFFAPHWPQNILKHLSTQARAKLSIEKTELHYDRPSRLLSTVLIAWCLFHVSFPLRGFWLDENISWSERGMRYAWRVMVREKMGSLTYRVRSKESGREWEVNPKSYLQPRQLSEMSAQPDMIIQLSHWIKRDFEQRMNSKVEVYADVWVSLNGRRPQRMINPELDLTRVSFSSPKLILPPPTVPPLQPSTL